jgi:uncharacterized protein YaiI (UPF0178 family)
VKATRVTGAVLQGFATSGETGYEGLVSEIRIFVDADACPVKDEVYKVAARYGLKTFVVSNSFMRVPLSPLIEQVVVDAGPDVADDWIAERVGPFDIAITNDIPLAERVLQAGGAALAATGKPFTADSIGSQIAQRALMEQLRSTGDFLGGPKAFDRNDRSRFLQALDEAVQKARRRRV